MTPYLYLTDTNRKHFLHKPQPSQFQILTLTNNQLYLRSNDSDNPIVVNISSLND